MRKAAVGLHELEQLLTRLPDGLQTGVQFVAGLFPLQPLLLHACEQSAAQRGDRRDGVHYLVRENARQLYPGIHLTVVQFALHIAQCHYAHALPPQGGGGLMPGQALIGEPLGRYLAHVRQYVGAQQLHCRLVVQQYVVALIHHHQSGVGGIEHHLKVPFALHLFVARPLQHLLDAVEPVVDGVVALASFGKAQRVVGILHGIEEQAQVALVVPVSAPQPHISGTDQHQQSQQNEHLRVHTSLSYYIMSASRCPV